MPKYPHEREINISVETFNKNTEQVILPIEIRNSYWNHKNVWQDINLKGHKSTNDEEGKHRGPILLIGSGPGTDDVMKRITEWKGPIITSISQASTAVYYGHDPDYIVGLDPKHRWETLDQVDTWKDRKSILILHPCMHPDFVVKWPLRKLYFRVYESFTDFYCKVLPIGYSFITGILFIFAHTVAAQVSFAHMLGYDPIILVGCEFGPGRYRRWFYEHKDEAVLKRGKLKSTKGWKAEKRPKKVGHRKEHLVTARNGVISDGLSLYYKRALFLVLRLDKPNILNCSRPEESVIDEIPFITFDEALKRQDTGYSDLYLPRQEFIDRMDVYIGRGNQWALVLEEDPEYIRYFELKDPIGTVPAILKKFEIETDGKPNIEKNMERIKWIQQKIKDDP